MENVLNTSFLLERRREQNWSIQKEISSSRHEHTYAHESFKYSRIRKDGHYWYCILRRIRQLNQLVVFQIGKLFSLLKISANYSACCVESWQNRQIIQLKIGKLLSLLKIGKLLSLLKIGKLFSLLKIEKKRQIIQAKQTQACCGGIDTNVTWCALWYDTHQKKFLSVHRRLIHVGHHKRYLLY